jgi:predicted DsbA family dithiol-disulfide isomerase
VADPISAASHNDRNEFHDMISPDIGKISTGMAAGSAETLQVDVIADFVCPWSYIGSRRLAAALTAVRGPSRVSWLPFQLNPAMPGEGLAFDDYLRERFGDPEALRPALAELTRQGAEDGIRFRFDLIRRIPNTLNAHRLMRLAGAAGMDASSLAVQLLRAFFEEGQNIGDREVLAVIAGDQGISPADQFATLDNDSSRKLVLSQEAEVRLSGVSGVPNFLINRRLFVVGALSTSCLVYVFDRAIFGDDSAQPVLETLQ